MGVRVRLIPSAQWHDSTVPFWAFFLTLSAAYLFLVLLVFSILEKANQTMSVISDFVAAMKGFQDRQSVALEGIRADVSGLKHSIDRLLANGTISDADVTALKEIQAGAQAAVEKLEALDAETPPEPPVADTTVAG